MLELFQGMFVPVVSIEDSAASKLLWIHKGSHKSRRDLRQLVRMATEDQRKNIEQLAKDLGLYTLLSDIATSRKSRMSKACVFGSLRRKHCIG